MQEETLTVCEACKEKKKKFDLQKKIKKIKMRLAITTPWTTFPRDDLGVDKVATVYTWSLGNISFFSS
uniref:Uncharacterized protein n=1 Tax=Timema cristinae TaxID=61476 RepID=A0A7R9H047_TIMCR|nr:unnamed protein product [Timema cristinae]